MLEKCRNAQERWGGVHLLIDRWLQERHELIQAYDGFHRSEQGPSRETLQSFCQILVDYVSAGHFEIYEQLVREAKAFGDERGIELAKQIYPRIEAITECLLAFDERCANGECHEDPNLNTELRRIGELLQERFELEDCLIEVLHNAHRQVEVSA